MFRVGFAARAADGADRRSVASHATNAGTNSSGAGGFYLQHTFQDNAAEGLSKARRRRIFDYRKPAKVNAGICPIVGSGS